MGTVSNLRQEEIFEKERKEEEEKQSRANRSNFEWFWSEYPKKKAKLEAQKAWKQTSDVRPDIEKIISAIAMQMKSDEWLRDCGAFIPHPATWLRQGRWDDE